MIKWDIFLLICDMNIARFTHWVRSASLQAYPELMHALGANPVPLLREHGLTAKLLENPETRLPLRAVNQLLERSALSTQRPDFGLLLASRRDFTDLGPISVVLKEEKTPRHAINTLLRYMKLLNASLVSHTEEVD
ncbi:MAG: AraC family transcriptional regulator ligand-binding domain-containing protein, partial [Hafnia sp.]